ncbi:MAG: hypothetical protein CMM01_01875 [Rhodopirellula sp.]|nr:hypothetical protein [Rhodopirellula sp.]
MVTVEKIVDILVQHTGCGHKTVQLARGYCTFCQIPAYNSSMNKSTVKAYLKKNQDPRGIEHWKKHDSSTLKSYSIGLTILRKYAQPIGRDAKLAKSLWKPDIYEM